MAYSSQGINTSQLDFNWLMDDNTLDNVISLTLRQVY